MEKMDQPIENRTISIFQTPIHQPELKTTMRDIASLAGVLNDLKSQQIYDSPLEILRFLKILQLLYEESLGLADTIDNVDTLYYRFRNTYTEQEPLTLEQIKSMVHVLTKYSWISKQSRQLKMMDRGKRMMDSLIRLANDSLAYYLQDDIGRSLFQARRDAEISAAYDDHGISGGNKIASMIRNVEEAIDKLEYRQLEYLADRNALPQLEIIHQLMSELEEKMKDRLQQFQTIEESLVMSDLVQRGTAALSKGTELSLGLLTKYIRFVSLQNAPVTKTISPEKMRAFILKMYNPPLESNIPTAYDLFSFMEQGQYEDEQLDGMWMPVKFAAPIGGMDIEGAVHYLETYEPKVNDPLEETEEIIFEEEIVEGETIQDVFQNASWQMTKSVINTQVIEDFLDEQGGSDIEELIIESSSHKWGDAIRSLLAVSALSNNQRIVTKSKENPKQYEKEWEWIEDDDRKFHVQSKQHEQSSDNE